MRTNFSEDFYSEDDQDDDDGDIFYHNYSVEYANQLLNVTDHSICSSKHFHRQFNSNRSERILKRSPRLMKISTWDQMILNQENQHRPITNSQPKFSSTINQQRTLPSLQQIDQELTRRTQRFIQEKRSTTTNPTNENLISPLTEEQLREVHQQQQLFQQHLLNMQRHLNEQQQRNPPNDQQRQMDRQEENSPINFPSSNKSKRNFQRNFDFDDDQEEIRQLIETDPYFAAAMEDFLRSHQLLDQRSTSPSSSSSTSSSSSSSSSRRSKSSSTSVETNKSSRLLNSNDQLLLEEIRGIRHLMKKYFHSKEKGEHWRYHPSIDPSMERPPHQIDSRRKREESRPQSSEYQNLVETMTQIIQRRSPSHQDQPLKPSQINPNYKAKFKQVHRIPPRPPPPPPLPSNSGLSSEQEKNSSNEFPRSSLTPPPRPPPSIIPRAPPLPRSLISSDENTKIRSNEQISTNSRQLSYGNQRTTTNVYDRFIHRFDSFSNKI